MEKDYEADTQYELTEDPEELFFEIRRLRKRNTIFLGVLVATVLGISILGFQFWQQKQASASFDQYYRYVNYDQGPSPGGAGGAGGGCCGGAGGGNGGPALPGGTGGQN